MENLNEKKTEVISRQNLEKMELNNRLQLRLMIHMANGDRDIARAHAMEWIRDNALTFRIVAEIWEKVHKEPLTLEEDSLSLIQVDLEALEKMEEGVGGVENGIEGKTLRQVWEEKYGKKFQEFLMLYPEKFQTYKNTIDSEIKLQIIKEIKDFVLIS